jgi:hypothetical protein
MTEIYTSEDEMEMVNYYNFISEYKKVELNDNEGLRKTKKPTFFEKQESTKFLIESEIKFRNTKIS